MDMQAVHRKKVDRIRRWIASHTENVVVCRFSCRVCKGRWHVAWTISRDQLQNFIYRPGAMERRNAEAFRFHPCCQGNLPFATQRFIKCEVWDNDTLELRLLVPSVSDRVVRDAARTSDRG